MQIAAKTVTVPVMHEMSSAVQKHGQKGRVQEQKAMHIATQTQVAIKIYIMVMHSHQWSNIMTSNIFFHALANNVTEEQVLKYQYNYKRI